MQSKCRFKSCTAANRVCGPGYHQHKCYKYKHSLDLAKELDSCKPVDLIQDEQSVTLWLLNDGTCPLEQKHVACSDMETLEWFIKFITWLATL